MSYTTIWRSIGDQALSGRITASIGQEIDPADGISAYAWFPSVQWVVVTAADVEAAYAFALNSGNPNPGGDPGVITDAMILSHVQAGLAVIPPPAGGVIPP